jgi:hypothetical protein
VDANRVQVGRYAGERIFDCREDERHFCITVEGESPVSFFADCEFEDELTDPQTAACLLEATLAVLAFCLEKCFGRKSAELWNKTKVCFSARS